MPSKLLIRPSDSAMDPQPRRIAISGPIGPVKNSRGADFARSETFIVVGAIKDCINEASEEMSKPNSTVVSEKNTERLATSTSVRQLPTFLTSKDASTEDRTQLAYGNEPPKHPKKTLFNSFIPKPHFASISSLTLKYGSKDIKQDENFTPEKLSRQASVEIKATTRLPRSRTMNALQELKNSVSRPSNLSNSTSTPNQTPKCSPKEKHDAKMAALNRRAFIVEESRTPANWSPRQAPPELQPGEVATAQSSAYWTGRFTALRDRFSTEHMNYVMPNVSTPPSTPSSTGYLRRASHASTQSDLSSYHEPPNHLQNDIDLCRRVFMHLTTLCVTGEARQSLRRWQEDYARRYNRPQLLPEGCTVQNRGIVSRLFGTKGRHPDRLGQAFLEEAYYSNASNAFGFTQHGVEEARYLNFR